MTAAGRPRLVLFTRFPEAGRAKTRLIPALGAAGAASLHRRLAERTLATMREADLPIEIRVTGAPVAAFRGWLGDRHGIVDQGEGDLGARLDRASRAPPVILLGADAPRLTASHLLEAAEAVAGGRFAIGPADDGGYWLLAIPHPAPFLFRDMPWSTASLFGRTIEVLAERGIEPLRLARLADLDRPEDLARFADLLP